MESSYKRLTWTQWRSGFSGEEIVLPSMNIENEDMEAGTDLGLRLGYSSEFIQRTLNIESGAGVNAGLRINIPFVASSPLSELVWSPHKGLGIKCAESTFRDTRPSTLFGVGEGNCLSKSPPINKLGIIPMGESSHERGTGGNGEGTNTVQVSLQLLHTDQDMRDGDGTCLSGPVNAQTEELPNTKEERISSLLGLGKGAATDVLSHKSDEVKAKFSPIEPSFGSGHQTIRGDNVLANPGQDCPMNECEASNFPTASVGEKRPSMGAEESTSKMKKMGLELTDENDSIGKNSCGEVGPTSEVGNVLLKALTGNVSAEQSPTNNEVGRCRRKGKERALSDGDVMSDSSHGSVESCNSAGLNPRGKKRWSFEQLLMQSKRAKKEIQESPSFVRKDSSFMNWISNMVKGFGKAADDKQPSTPHIQDSGSSLNMGFQSMFKSLYCSSTVVNDSIDPELPTKMSDIDATPIAYRRESGTSCKLFTPSSEKLNESISKTESAKPNALPVNSDSIQEHCMTSSAENINSHALVLDRDGERTSPKQKTDNSAENNNSDLPSEGKTTHILSSRSDALGSLWITRFSPKTSGPLSHAVHRNLSSVCTKLDSHHHNNPVGAEEPQTSPDRELQNTEVSSGPQRINDDDNLCKLDSNLSSQRFKSSEAMASVFARRLDALKHIVSSGVTDDAARAATTCFFCGIRGHHLQECPEIAETELEDLLRNINLHGEAQESSCLCIRCFQLNHWAVACPNSLGQPREVHGSTSKLLHSKESGVEFEAMLKHKLNEASGRMVSGSSCVKDESRAEQIGRLNRQMPETPMGIFDAIKKLRLSRTDILKWMNSHIPLSCLNGFFLRLRLGKWEEGLGGTGYYVACIDGSELESLSPNPRNVIPVNVGSIKCLVESQYISNHDFCEDELVAWWNATTRNGGEIPSIEDLGAKIKEKSNLHS